MRIERRREILTRVYHGVFSVAADWSNWPWTARCWKNPALLLASPAQRSIDLIRNPFVHYPIMAGPLAELRAEIVTTHVF